MLISILTSIVIFPFFARIDIENRFCYSLKNLQRMYYFIIQAFLSKDKIHAKICLSRATILEQMIRPTIIVMKSRIPETIYEPSKIRQRRLTIEGKKNFLI